MGLDATTLAADLEEIESDLDQTFTLDGSSYACVASEIGHDHEMADIAGYTDNRRVLIVARQSLFSSLPAVGNTITHNDVTFRIVATELDPTAAAINLICEEILA